MNIKPLDNAPFAYHDQYDFPENYEPWKLNYEGHGLFIGVFLLFVYGKIYNYIAESAYEVGYLNRTG